MAGYFRLDGYDLTARTAAILGTVGIPARYGGFETLAEALVREAEALGIADRIAVYCSAPQTARPRPRRWHGARLIYLPIRANGVHSVAYDIVSLMRAAWSGADCILLLGVSGTVALPLIRLTSRARLIVHVDGLEWQRAKWTGFAKAFLRLSERMAVRWAHEVIADNPAVARHIAAVYGRRPTLVAYGGEQSRRTPPGDISDLDLPERYLLAIARVEPENNLDLILETLAAMPTHALVVAGNWNRSSYGRSLRHRFARHANLHLIDTVYDPGRLRALRDRASVYLHGHGAGGTNPSLVEMMHFGVPIAAFDCAFNREATDDAACFFHDAETLRAAIDRLSGPDGPDRAAALTRIAREKYRWRDVAARYFDLMGLAAQASPRDDTPL